MGYLPVFWGSGSPCAAPLSALGLPSPAQGCWDLGQLSQTRAKPQGAEMGLFPSTLKLGRSCSLFLLPIPQLSSLSLLRLHPWLPPHHPAPCPAPPAFPSLAFLCHPCCAAEPCFSPSPEGFPWPHRWKRLGHKACSSLTVMFCSCPTQTKQRSLQHSCVTRNPVSAKIPNRASPRCTLTDQLASGAIAKPFPQEVALKWYFILYFVSSLLLSGLPW